MNYIIELVIWSILASGCLYFAVGTKTPGKYIHGSAMVGMTVMGLVDLAVGFNASAGMIAYVATSVITHNVIRRRKEREEVWETLKTPVVR